jgi:hypothetical protein
LPSPGPIFLAQVFLGPFFLGLFFPGRLARALLGLGHGFGSCFLKFSNFLRFRVLEAFLPTKKGLVESLKIRRGKKTGNNPGNCQLEKRYTSGTKKIAKDKTSRINNVKIKLKKLPHSKHLAQMRLGDSTRGPRKRSSLLGPLTASV